MKKKNIVKKNTDFKKIIESTKPHKSKEFLIFVKENNLNTYRFGISISKKTGNAVMRNKIKRKIKNILHNNKELFKNGYDCIIIVSRSVLDLNYNEIYKKLINELSKSKVCFGKGEENETKTD